MYDVYLVVFKFFWGLGTTYDVHLVVFKSCKWFVADKPCILNEYVCMHELFKYLIIIHYIPLLYIQ